MPYGNPHGYKMKPKAKSKGKATGRSAQTRRVSPRKRMAMAGAKRK